MHRALLLELLERYHPFDQHEQRMYHQLEQFVQTNSECFSRELLAGHITGSAWIIDHQRQHILLTHHRKLDRWLQLGGHCDGNADVAQVALREAQEESGLTHIHFLSPDIFDLDIHSIPATAREPKHYHYDVRFLFTADHTQPLVISQESKELAWIPIDKVASLTQDSSILRMLHKCSQR